MSVIKAKCIDQVLYLESTPVITSGGLEENFVEFSFCSQWVGHVRTAVFWRSEEEPYHMLLDEDDRCQVPPEVTADEGVFHFGVFGVNEAGVQRTSNVLTYRVDKGAITTNTKPSDPTADIYTQLLQLKAGKDGISPVVEMSKEDGVTTLAITDAAGTKTAEIKDGISPVVGVSEEDGVTKLTFTDVNGAKTVEIGDGGQIAAGSYVGTGTYGEDNPTALTFDFVPEMLFVGASPYLLVSGYGTYNDPGFSDQMLVFNLAAASSVRVVFRAEGVTGVGNLYFVEKGNTVSWYGDHVSVDVTEDVTAECAAAQLNTEGQTYYYLAIGTGGSSGIVVSGSLTDEDKTEIKDSVLAELDPTVTAISTVLSGTTMTFTETLEDGSTDTIEVTLDENGVPTGMTVNGTAVGVTMEGF